MNIPNQSNNPVFERQSWFSNRKALEYIRYCLKAARQDIRVNVLEAIVCHEGTEIANVDYPEPEEISHFCIQAWCEKHNAKQEDVERICTLYLKPEKAEDGLADLLI